MKQLYRLSFFTIAGFFGAAVNFFLLPVLSHYLSPKDYGTLSLVNNYVSLMAPFISFLAYALLSVEYFKKGKEEFASLFTSIQVIPLLPAIVLGLLFYAGYNRVAGLMELPVGEAWLSILIVLLVVLITYTETANAYLINSKQVIWYLIFTIIRVGVETLLTVYFVIYLSMGWEGRLYSWFISSIVCALLSYYIFVKNGLINFRSIKKHYILQGLVFGLPLIGHEIGKYVINQSNRLFIAKMISVDEAGIFNVGSTIGLVVMIFVTALVNYYSPVIMENLATRGEEYKKKLVRITYQFFGLMIFAFIALNLISPLLFKYLIDHKYLTGSPYVFWVSLGYVFWGVYLIFSSYIFYFHKTRFLAILSVINVAINISLNYILISLFGGLGAAYATAVSFFITMLITIWFVNKLIKLPWMLNIKLYK